MRRLQIDRRRAAQWLAALSAAPGMAPLALAARADRGDGTDVRGRKVLRLAFVRAETSFDPARIVDLYSRVVTAHIFEALYTYDHLARPAKVRPLTAAAMPEASADFRVWTVRIQPGIFFADDPAFGGKPRELVAADYVYSLKRPADPIYKSPGVGELLDTGFVGLSALRAQAIQNKQPFDYDRPIAGLQALDKYTLRLVTEQPRPRLPYFLAACDLHGAVAREVVAHYGDRLDAHPVGTGPFRLKSWRRSSEIVLERNPGYRARYYDAEPAADDAAGQAMAAQFKGRRLPMVDEVRIAVIEESQPLWLAFLNGQLDALATIAGRVPPEFSAQAMPGGKLAPHLAKRGIQGQRSLNPDIAFAYFNMEDAVVGGYTPERVALRRAIALAYDNGAEIRQIRNGGIPGQSPVVPHTSGYDSVFKSEMGDHDPARARALLDLYGYVDRNGDGWRERPDGSPLLLKMATQPDQTSRKIAELWQKCMTAVNLRVDFVNAQWPENLKAAYAGKLQMWQLGSTADTPDGQSGLAKFYTDEIGSQNLARFSRPEFDRLYAQMRALPDGPERLALFEQAKRIAVAWMPYKVTTHRQEADLLHGWVSGYRRPTFWLEWWHMVDVDSARRDAWKA